MRDTPIIYGAIACLFSLALFLHLWLPVKWHTTRSDCLLSLEMSFTPNDLSHLSDAEFFALCPQGEHAPGPEPLSPAPAADRPLWEVVAQARYNSDGARMASVRLATAAEIDAVASWLEQRYLDRYPGAAELLRAEAQRAREGA